MARKTDTRKCSTVETQAKMKDCQDEKELFSIYFGNDVKPHRKAPISQDTPKTKEKSKSLSYTFGEGIDEKTQKSITSLLNSITIDGKGFNPAKGMIARRGTLDTSFDYEDSESGLSFSIEISNGNKVIIDSMKRALPGGIIIHINKTAAKHFVTPPFDIGNLTEINKILNPKNHGPLHLEVYKNKAISIQRKDGQEVWKAAPGKVFKVFPSKVMMRDKNGTGYDLYADKGVWIASELSFPVSYQAMSTDTDENIELIKREFGEGNYGIFAGETSLLMTKNRKIYTKEQKEVSKTAKRK